MKIGVHRSQVAGIEPIRRYHIPEPWHAWDERAMVATLLCYASKARRRAGASRQRLRVRNKKDANLICCERAAAIACHTNKPHHARPKTKNRQEPVKNRQKTGSAFFSRICHFKRGAAACFRREHVGGDAFKLCSRKKSTM